MIMNYYISDLHLSHKRIIESCHRPFDDVKQMNRFILEKWNKKVKDNDHVYILGDVMYADEDSVETFMQFNGAKHLIVGNRDVHLLKHRWFRNFFVEITPYKEVEDKGRNIVLCHYPMAEWNGYFRGYYHFFGHIHNAKNDAWWIMKDMERAFNVGADEIGFVPRSADELIG